MTPSVSTKHEYMTPSQMVESAATATAVTAAPLAGTWNNVNTATRDIVKVVITAAGSGIKVDAFGACSPTPCNWGNVAGLAYAANVSSSPAVAFSAQYKFSFFRSSSPAIFRGRTSFSSRSRTLPMAVGDRTTTARIRWLNDGSKGCAEFGAMSGRRFISRQFSFPATMVRKTYSGGLMPLRRR